MIKRLNNLVYLLILKIKYKNSLIIKKCSITHFLPKIRISDGGKIIIGKDLMCEKNVSIESYGGMIEIGDNVFINTNVKIVSKDKIEIGDDCIIAPNVCIYDHDHDYKSSDVINNYVLGNIKIKNKVWIGANSIILKNTTIGNRCVVAAGSIVSGNVSDNKMYIQKKKHEFINIEKKEM